MKVEILTLEQREKTWDRICEALETTNDLNSKSVLVQTAISEFGPVPNSRGDAVRMLLKPSPNRVERKK